MMPSANPALRVRFRGVRGSIPSPGKHTARYGGNTACVELRIGDQLLILDAGSGIRQLGAELIVESAADRAIEATLLVTHTHWDHIQGLPFFAPIFFPQNRVRLVGGAGMQSHLQQALRNQMQPMHFPVGLQQMVGLSSVDEFRSGDTFGRFTVREFAANHPGGSSGFRVEAGGVSVAYLPDHEPFDSSCHAPGSTDAKARTEALLDFVRGVDLLILDTQYTDAEYPHHVGWGHGCVSHSVALALAADARQLALFHHDPSHDDAQMDAILDRARYLARGSKLHVTAAIEDESLLLAAEQFLVRKPAIYTLVESAA